MTEKLGFEPHQVFRAEVVYTRDGIKDGTIVGKTISYRCFSDAQLAKRYGKNQLINGHGGSIEVIPCFITRPLTETELEQLATVGLQVAIVWTAEHLQNLSD